MHVRSVEIKRELFPDPEIYPYHLPCLAGDSSLELGPGTTFLVGENGSGKSTLLSAIAKRADIHIWKGFQRSRYQRSPHEDALFQFLSLHWTDAPVPGAFFSSELFKNFSRLLDEWASSDPGILEYFGSRSLLTLSHGQGHMAFFRNRFFRSGLYLLDEPETALSPSTQLELLALLEEAGASGDAQFVIATHSPILLSVRGARIIDLDSPGFHAIPYRETQHYRVYRDFFLDT